MVKKYQCQSLAETAEVARELARKLEKTGGFVCLTGELGAGKTAFVREMCAALGIAAQVSSPTFSLVNEYQAGVLPFYHFDVYRLADGVEAEEAGVDEYFDKSGVICAVEWAERVAELVPSGAFWVEIRRDSARGDGFRYITVEVRE